MKKLKSSKDYIINSKWGHAYKDNKLLLQRNPELFEDLFEDIEDVLPSEESKTKVRQCKLLSNKEESEADLSAKDIKTKALTGIWRLKDQIKVKDQLQLLVRKDRIKSDIKPR